MRGIVALGNLLAIALANGGVAHMDITDRALTSFKD
jgi:hypothetical protein